MCGIAGIYHCDDRPVSVAALLPMAEVLHHRGPDDRGFVLIDTKAATPRSVTYQDPHAVHHPQMTRMNLGFAHQRLSIVDLTSAGHQPMSNDDGTIWLVYNGEIYNYIEVRDELLRAGHTFKSRTDTEVVLRAYETWGPSCVDHFNGMWAFALWDARRNTLFCSRDRFGVKPFYYTWNGTCLIFASEIKGILASGLLQPVVNDNAVYAYLRTGYGYLDTADETFFQEIHKLPPATNMILRDGVLKFIRYWDLTAYADESEDLLAEFAHRFHDAVRLRVRSDVKVGGALSGGLDSSSIACIAAQVLGPEHYETFSVCYDDMRYDERQFILSVVRATGLKHHFVFPRPTNFLETTTKILWHQDEPFPDLNIYSQWWMYAEVKRQGVKVFLNGHGGDEVLGGYVHHHLAFLVDLLRDAHFKRVATELRCYARNHHLGLTACLRQVLLRFASASTPQLLKRSVGRLWSTNPSYLQPYFAKCHEGQLSGRIFRHGGSLLKQDLLESFWYAPLPAWLHLEDRNSMAFSIESRNPFLDYRVVELLFRVPYQMRFRDGMSKYILREAMRGVLPEEVRSRTDKQGFQSAGEQWFRSELHGVIHDILASPSLRDRGYLDQQKILEGFERHARGDANLRFAIWSWVCLELWFRHVVEKYPTVPVEVVA